VKLITLSTATADMQQRTIRQKWPLLQNHLSTILILTSIIICNQIYNK